jgi:hypothetical protein
MGLENINLDIEMDTMNFEIFILNLKFFERFVLA